MINPCNVVKEIWVVHVQDECGGLVGIGNEYHLSSGSADGQVKEIAETLPKYTALVTRYVAQLDKAAP